MNENRRRVVLRKGAGSCMSREIYVIVDCSGSMKAQGKESILRDLCRRIARAARALPDVSCRLFRWQESITPLEKIGDIVPRRRAGAESLAQFVAARQEDISYLLVSDGIWEVGAGRRLQKILAARDVRLMTMLVGGDANATTLARVTTVGGEAWEAMDVHAAIELLAYADVRGRV